MDRNQALTALLAWTGLFTMLLALVDPLEGFPLVLVGGALMVIAAYRVANPFFRRLTVSGLVLAATGCGAMLWLSALGGIGGPQGLPPAWGWVMAPYPIGWLMLIAGSFLILKTRVHS